MRFKKTSAGLAAGGLALIAGPAMASGLGTTVSVGGSTAGADHPITATSGPIQFDVLNDAGVVISMTCESATVKAPSSVHSGTGVVDLATIAPTMEWTKCQGPGGTLNVTNVGDWHLHRDGSATTGLETVPGHVDDVTAQVDSAIPGICSFTVTGQAEGAFDETNQTLTVTETGFDGDLTIASVDPGAPCLGQIQAGNPANFQGVFNVTSPDGAINLSQ